MLPTASANHPRIFNFPNFLTLARITVIPLIIVLVRLNQPAFSILATILLILAALSDALDGFWARKRKDTTAFGSFLDPLADKILVLSLLSTLIGMDPSPLMLITVILILSREIVVSALLEIAASQKKTITLPKTNLPRMILLYLALIFLLMRGVDFHVNFEHLGLLLLILAAIFSIFSAMEYAFQFSSKTTPDMNA